MGKGPCHDSKVLVLSGHTGLVKFKPRIAVEGFGAERTGMSHSVMQLGPDRRNMSQL